MPVLPKHPSTRARRNRSSTSATLVPNPKIRAPALPKRGTAWHPMTRQWWRDVWASPMAPEFDPSDKHGLLMLAAIVDDFWTADNSRSRRDAAAEIRHQSQRYGLSPVDRRRLQWEIERTAEALERAKRRRDAAKPPAKGQPDPRTHLSLV